MFSQTAEYALRAVDAVHRIRDCPLGKPAHASGLCPLHRRMDEVRAAAETAMRQTRISELLDAPDLNNLCQFPYVAAPLAGAHGEDCHHPACATTAP